MIEGRSTWLINLGYYNWVQADKVKLILDYRLSAAKRIIELWRSKDPDNFAMNVLNLTKGKKHETLVILTDGQCVITSKSRIQIYNELSKKENQIIQNPKKRSAIKKTQQAQDRIQGKRLENAERIGLPEEES